MTFILLTTFFIYFSTSQYPFMQTVGAIYSWGSSPGTFSHPIPYCKASLINSLDAHSSMNSWWDSISQGIESKGTPNDNDPSWQNEEVTGGRIGIGTEFSNLGETSQGADNGSLSR